MEHYTSEGWIQHLVTQAIACGADQNSIFKLTGIKSNVLISPSLVKVPMEKAYPLFRLLHECNFQATKELDLVVTSTLPMLNSDIHGAYFNNSPDMTTFIKRLTNMFEQQTSSIKVDLEVGSYTTNIYFDFINNKCEFYVPQAVFLLFVLLAKSIFNLDERLLQQIIVGITQPKIPDHEVFCLHVTDRIYTQQTRAFIQIPTPMLEIENTRFNPLLCDFLTKEYNKVYGKTESSDKLITNIISHICSQWGSSAESINLEHVAKSIGMSRSKLYRELNQRNIKFSEIVESQRKKIALEQIKKRDVNIAEISDRLGYANVSAFTRAFNRWFNTNPSKMRQ